MYKIILLQQVDNYITFWIQNESCKIKLRIENNKYIHLYGVGNFQYELLKDFLKDNPEITL